MELTEKKLGIKSFRVQLEKMDGGFVSNVTGRRAIYKYAQDITEHVNIESVIDALDDNEYHLNIDIIPKALVEDYHDLVDQMTSDKPVEIPEITYQQAKEQGIIQEADKFNPHPVFKEQIVEEGSIAITADNCYTVARLKSINWNHYHEQLPLSVNERCDVSGCNKQVMYTQWKKVLDGKASFHLSSTRVSFTILAKYYEKKLGLRSSSKEQLEKVKADVLAQLRELEVATSNIKYVKNTLILAAISKLRKQLL